MTKLTQTCRFYRNLDSVSLPGLLKLVFELRSQAFPENSNQQHCLLRDREREKQQKHQNHKMVCGPDAVQVSPEPAERQLQGLADVRFMVRVCVCLCVRASMGLYVMWPGCSLWPEGKVSKTAHLPTVFTH